jgi:hypothetical protein
MYRPGNRCAVLETTSCLLPGYLGKEAQRGVEEMTRALKNLETATKDIEDLDDESHLLRKPNLLGS